MQTLLDVTADNFPACVLQAVEHAQHKMPSLPVAEWQQIEGAMETKLGGTGPGASASLDGALARLDRIPTRSVLGMQQGPM